MPQFDYDEAILINGQVADSSPAAIDSYLNPLLAQQDDTVFAGFVGNNEIQIVGEEGTFTSGTFTGGSTTLMIDNAIAGFGDTLDNVATLANADPNLEIRFIHPDREYTISYPQNNATMSTTVVQLPGGTNIPLGVVVVQGANDDEATLPTGTSVAADALGISIRNTSTDVNTGVPTDVDGLPAGNVISTLRGGVVAVEVEDAVTANAACFFRIQNAGAGERIGGLRSDVDGGDAVALTDAVFKTTTAAGGIAKVKINKP
jgi:hypothetical protein